MITKRSKKRKKHLTLSVIRKQYDYYNRLVFRDSLPKVVEFAVVRRTDCLAESSQIINVPSKSHSHYRIEFSRDFWRLQSTRLAYVVLLHEMTHLAAGIHHGHNKLFEANRKRLIDIGTYDNLL